ncbi:hypothetical protein [Mesorhizobium neociceri]|uniref:Uncharacterized protein n=1 Tax=Mesorhizobium neociceri TaxID=1307853 RepID=A0A838BE48_9HYPH|nr:hypothetical protein [Mesorhizobium neociceri]MBA1144523.1 hypothetical protein [Mesorhizobium neociceri]
MSEYQYYEFQAIDRPLSNADRRALRDLSSRARITATSFTNYYEWGDFKGDPDKLMERWFDLHLYLANWGSRRLMIKLPARLVDQDRIRDILGSAEDVALAMTGENVILSIAREELEHDYGDEDDSSWLAALAPLRVDLLAGDLRLVYLLWLMAVEIDAVKPDEAEPMPGIGPLTDALDAFVEFFGVDRDLVRAAAEQGAAMHPDGAPEVARRTVATLQDRAAAIRLAREHAKAELAAAQQRLSDEAAEKARQLRLDAVHRRGESIWEDIEKEIIRSNPAGYHKAAALLFDLQTLAERHDTVEAFRLRLQAIRERHSGKGRFIERLRLLG